MTCVFYERNPKNQFTFNHAGPRVNKPGEGKAQDFFQLFVSYELQKIEGWANRWFEVKRQMEPDKYGMPLEPVTDTEELKPYFALLLAINQDVDLPQYEHYSSQDETKWLFSTPGFMKVDIFSAKSLCVFL